MCSLKLNKNICKLRKVVDVPMYYPDQPHVRFGLGCTLVCFWLSWDFSCRKQWVRLFKCIQLNQYNPLNIPNNVILRNFNKQTQLLYNKLYFLSLHLSLTSCLVSFFNLIIVLLLCCHFVSFFVSLTNSS